MVIVGLGKAKHDSSVCALINNEIKYAKFERQFNVKHGGGNDAWYWHTLKTWGITYPDFTVYTDERELGSVPRLPLNGEEYLHIKENNFFMLDHHFAHLWSNTKFKNHNQGVVIDGQGSGDHTMLIKKKNNETLRSKEYNPALLYEAIGIAMGLIYNNNYVDAAGKVMGLVAHGNFNQELYDKFKTFKLEDFTNYLKIIYKENNQEWRDIVATLDVLCFDYIKGVFKQLDKKEEIFYSGGAALNVQWNMLLHEEGYKLNLEPHPYDGGLSIGCVRWACNYLNVNFPKFNNFPYIQEPYYD